MSTETAKLEKKVREMELLIGEVQKQLSATRKSEKKKETQSEVVDDVEEQLNTLTSELEEATRRNMMFELDIARLTEELAEAKASSKRGGLEDIAVLGSLMKEKDEQIARLSDENKRLRETTADEVRRAKNRNAKLIAELERHSMLIAELEKQLTQRTDYDAIKKELSLLRDVEFGAAAEANTDTIARFEKSKRLQNEATRGGDKKEKVFKPSCKPDAVEAVSRLVGKEVVRKHIDSNDILVVEDGYTPTAEKPPCKAEKNLFDILMNMGKSMPSSSGSSAKKSSENGHTDSSKTVKDDLSTANSLRFSPKISNYAGEPPKSSQELQAIQDLQAKIAGNVEKLKDRALNTAELAKQCKRLMLAYNIGQRLFAKNVMNQVVKSQGSLSELLSKPRHWSKLTDKGREAFRRIYAWLSDDEAIEMLCALSPRRVWPAGSEVHVDHPTPESLWDCNRDSLPPEPTEEVTAKRVASAREDQYRLAGTNGSSAASASSTNNTNSNNNSNNNSNTNNANNVANSTRNSRWRHDDIPKEKIFSIFQTELAKLREQESNLEKAISSRSMTNGGSQCRRVDDLTNYHEMSPTERLASINHAHKVMMSRMETGLVPITQQQFDSFPQMDTEEIVRQIKEFLSIHTISQRQFGELVLGLSQGSVSDLLARPKPWTSLTQKGREPFIRMQLFLVEVAETAEQHRNLMLQDEEFHEENDCEAVEGVSDDSVTLVKDEPEEEEPRSEIDIAAEASTTDDTIDTAVIAKKVKERLTLHGISQRLFGESVLGSSSGGISDYLSRPRKWGVLSARGKEHYEKMQAWLNDKDAISKIKTKVENGASEKQESENKKRPSDAGLEHSPPRKVQRTVITDQQKEALRFVYTHDHHPSQKTVELLSLKLNLNIRTVNNWFHNYRTRQKASLRDGKETAPLPEVTISKDWQKELSKLLDTVSQQSLLEDMLPTMVNMDVPLFEDDDEDEEDLSDASPKHKASQLELAVAKMHQMAAAKK